MYICICGLNCFSKLKQIKPKCRKLVWFKKVVNY